MELIGFGVVLVVLVVAAIYNSITGHFAAKKEAVAKDNALIQYQRWVNSVNKYNRLNLTNISRVPELISHKNEYVFGYSDSTLCELRAIINGNYGGFSFRVCKGVNFHTGGVKGESHDELRAISRGKFIITNDRIVFVGTGLKREIKMDKVAGITSGWDYIEVSVEDKQKSMFFTGINGNIYRDMVNAIIDSRNKGFRSADFSEVWKSI